MTDPSARPAKPAAALSARVFLQAVPELGRIEAALGEALRPAMTQASSEDHGFADAAWMLAKALRFLLQAATAPDGGGAALDEALAEVDADLQAAAGYTRILRAAAATPQALAAAGEAVRINAAELGEHLATAVTIVTMTDDDNRGLETDEFQAEVDADGRISLTSLRHGQLPVDGRAQLDLAAALEALGTVCGRAAATAAAPS